MERVREAMLKVIERETTGSYQRELKHALDLGMRLFDIARRAAPGPAPTMTGGVPPGCVHPAPACGVALTLQAQIEDRDTWVSLANAARDAALKERDTAVRERDAARAELAAARAEVEASRKGRQDDAERAAAALASVRHELAGARSFATETARRLRETSEALCDVSRQRDALKVERDEWVAVANAKNAAQHDASEELEAARAATKAALDERDAAREVIDNTRFYLTRSGMIANINPGLIAQWEREAPSAQKHTAGDRTPGVTTSRSRVQINSIVAEVTEGANIRISTAHAGGLIRYRGTPDGTRTWEVVVDRADRDDLLLALTLVGVP